MDNGLKKRIGIYAGTFDPPTNGHLWVMSRGAELFDELNVVLAANPEKKTLLSVEERQEMLKKLTAETPGRIRVDTVEKEFLADFARKVGSKLFIARHPQHSGFRVRESNGAHERANGKHANHLSDTTGRLGKRFIVGNTRICGCAGLGALGEGVRAALRV